MSSTMLLINPKWKNLKKGGRKTVAKTKKKSNAVKKTKKAVRRAIKTPAFKQIIMPTMFIVGSIMATKLIKNKILPKLSFVPLKMQNLAAGAAVAAGFYFGRRFIKSPAIWIGAALSVPVIDMITGAAPNIMAGLVDMRTKQALPFAGNRAGLANPVVTHRKVSNRFKSKYAK